MAAGAAASVVGRLGVFELGKDKIKIYKKFTDWVGEAESKMKLLGPGLTTGDQKTNFIRSCAGPELTMFWDKEARIRWEVGVVAAPQAAHTYKDNIDESKKTILKNISRDWLSLTCYTYPRQ